MLEFLGIGIILNFRVFLWVVVGMLGWVGFNAAVRDVGFGFRVVIAWFAFNLGFLLGVC